MTPLGIILAGGQATRMGGGDKGLLTLGSESLLARVISRLGPQVGAIALNANGDPTRFADFGLPVVADPVGGFAGPLAGVLAGMDWAAGQGASHVVSAAADTPFFPVDLTERFIGAEAGASPVLAASPGGRHPTFGLWPVALRNDLRAALENGLRKVVAWSDRHGGREVIWPDDQMFFNVNTPEDLVAAEAML